MRKTKKKQRTMSKKEQAIREGVDRLLSQKSNPAQIDRLVRTLTGTDIEERSIPERLGILLTRIRELREETGDLSGLLEYHSGSRLSQVVDLLNQAEVLTEETMRQTTGREVRVES